MTSDRHNSLRSGLGEQGDMKERPRVVNHFRPLALVVLAGISGCFVWAVHTGDVFLMSLAFLVGGSLGLFAGLVVGVTLPETIVTMGGLTGLFGGIAWGFATYGWVGAVLGGPLGLISGSIASIPMMLIFVLIVSLGSGSGAGEGAENR